MKVKAAAKINYVLDITGKLSDGYHSLFMINTSVSLFDEIEVLRTGGTEIKLFCDGNIPSDKTNIAYKCAERFFKYAHVPISEQGIKITIKKNIPSGAGLAGGSADGAGVLYCLNKLYGNLLDSVMLSEVGLSVGADIPFSLIGGKAFCLNKGEIIAPIKQYEDCFIVLVKPDISTETGTAYQMIDSAVGLRHTDIKRCFEDHIRNDLPRMCMNMFNVFEQVISFSDRPLIKSVLRKYGAQGTVMSGSGSSVYGVYKLEENAKSAYSELKKNFKNTYLLTPTKKSIYEI